MKPQSITCAGLHELDAVASRILDLYPQARVFAISGAMGAGKTTFIQALCRNLSVSDTVTSPTFSLVNEYRTSNNTPVFHFDLYRLRKPEELLDIGYEEYFYSGHYCFVEWPEIAAGLIPDDCLKIYIEVEELTKIRYFNIG